MLQKAKAAKFFVIVFFSSGEQLKRGEQKLRKKLGEIDYVSPSYTLPSLTEILLLQRKELQYSYRVYSFLRLISREEIVQLQRNCLKLQELSLLKKDMRNNKFSRFYRVTAGYLSLSNIITVWPEENFSRIYLFGKMYAQPELIFEGGKYRLLEFASPELKNPMINEYFSQLRGIYQKQLEIRYGKRRSVGTAD
jgi:hypothetical protein